MGELERNAADPESASACNQAIIAAGDTLANSPLPTIAMIHGACIGGGVELAVLPSGNGAHQISTDCL